MSNTRTITAANAVLTLGVINLFNTPRTIRGFSADDVTEIEPLTNGETTMGVDGRLSAGFVFNPVPQGITLQADSQSNDFFDQWQQAERQAREKYEAFGSILLLATGTRYTLTRGFITQVSIMPAIRKTLQARKFMITWEKVIASPS